MFVMLVMRAFSTLRLTFQRMYVQMPGVFF